MLKEGEVYINYKRADLAEDRFIFTIFRLKEAIISPIEKTLFICSNIISNSTKKYMKETEFKLSPESPFAQNSVSVHEYKRRVIQILFENYY